MKLLKLIFSPEGHAEVDLDLTGMCVHAFPYCPLCMCTYMSLNSSQLACILNTGDLKTLKKSSITIKEGCQYKLKIQFRVQREIVAGLRYFQATHRKGLKGEVYYDKSTSCSY